MYLRQYLSRIWPNIGESNQWQSRPSSEFTLWCPFGLPAQSWAFDLWHSLTLDLSQDLNLDLSQVLKRCFGWMIDCFSGQLFSGYYVAYGYD